MVLLAQISGFLGSGKTSSIIRMATEAQKKGLKTAVIVNEIGDVDVDGEFVKSSGLKAKRILGGCICCSLGADLVSTIKIVVEEFKPDVIFVEPTGVALPSQVKRFFVQASYLVPGLEFSPTVALVDGVRFRSLLAEFKDFLTKQARDAEILALTKIDRIDKKFDLPLIVSALSEMRPGTKVIGVSSVTGEGMPDLLAAILGERVELDSEANPAQDDSVAESGVGNADFYGILRSDKDLDDKAIRSFVSEVIEAMGRKCIEKTGRILGHIKAFGESQGKGFKASMVDLTTGVEFSGDIPQSWKELKFSLFMALEGFGSEDMRSYLKETIRETSKKYGLSVEDLHHQHHN
ncbi:MAG: GTP-binding protein [Candidatus Methanosuratincola verstraetei]|jgi:G3E family GTPase|uniref:CobW/HypB/UreG nucleotide-binding domain-containing protein n=1 Tax=Candidatus Methanosuratincola petrocarbonis (ex Vanwonterghem et al. 2016) TaxID=1867261 RepID=A0A7J3UYE9_9CREN